MRKPSVRTVKGLALKEGTYKVKVQLTAAGTKNYKKSAKTLTFYVRVK